MAVGAAGIAGALGSLEVVELGLAASRPVAVVALAKPG